MIRDLDTASSLDLLKNGLNSFKLNHFDQEFEALMDSQDPKTVLVGCCDSRVDPAILTECRPGQIFCVRNVANLVAPYEKASTFCHGTSTALEYAVKILDVENIIVMGHSSCGGIDALMTGKSKELEFMSRWLEIARPAFDKTIKEFGDADLEVQRSACEQASVLESLKNLESYPFILEKLKAGKLTISGWYFNIQSGDILSYDKASGKFSKLLDEADCPPK